MEVKVNKLTPELFLDLYTSVGWEAPVIQQAPSFQSKGVGTILMESIEKYIKENIDENWAVSLELISTKEAVGFYKKKGFEERPCEWDGPGMFKMIG